MRRQHAQADDKDIPERLEVVRIEAGVDDVEEDGRHGSRTGEGVFDSRVFGKELRWKVISGEVLVVGREAIVNQQGDGMSIGG